MSDLRLPYTKEELLNLLGNIKNEEELREFIQQNSASAGGGHTDEEIRIIVAEWYQQNKDTQLTKEDVDGWIAEYLAENPVSGGAFIDDNSVSENSTWSSYKVDEEIQDYTGGKKQRYVTQSEYDALTDTDKNDTSICWNITDASSSSLTDEQISKINAVGDVSALNDLGYSDLVSAVKYIIENSGNVDVTKYTVTNNLTNVTSTNSISSVNENTSYNATLSADNGYTLDSVTITMGGVDITSKAYTDGVITISAVTGNIIITAMATFNSQPSEIDTNTMVDIDTLNATVLNSEYYVSGKAWASSGDTYEDKEYRSAYIPKVSLDAGEHTISYTKPSSRAMPMLRIVNADGSVSSTVRPETINSSSTGAEATFTTTSGQYVRLFLFDPTESTNKKLITVEDFNAISIS